MSEDDKNLFKKLTGYKERLWRKLQDCYELTSQLPQKLSQFKLRVEQLHKVRNEFGKTLDSLHMLSDKREEFSTDVVQLESSFDDLYFEILACAGQYSEPINEPQSIINLSGKRELSLRDVNLTKFDGSPEKFPAFRAMYDALVHNTGYSDIEKFTILINHLENSALKFAQTVRFSPENYNVIYNQLIQRYTNKRIIANHYLRTIFGLKPINNDSFEGISELCEVLQTNVTALGDMKIPNLTDYIFVQFSLKLLDNKSKEEFEKNYLDTEFPTFNNLIKFLRNKCSVSQLVGESSSSSTMVRTPHADYMKNKGMNGSYKRKVTMFSQEFGNVDKTKEKSYNCMFCCQKDHFRLTKCPEFIALSPVERHDFVRSKGLCYACLYPHRIADCRMKINCEFCSSTRHNTLLHQREFADKNQFSESQLGASNSVALSCLETKKCDSLLGTAKALIRINTGEWCPCRIVLDSGSQVNFITERLANCLGKKRKRCLYEISGIGEVNPLKPHGILDCEITSLYNSDFVLNFEAVVLSRITANLPTTSLSDSVKSGFESLELADREFNISSPIDVLLGIQAVLDLTPTPPSIIKGCPSAYLTSLGWVILGNVESPIPSVGKMVSNISIENENSLNEILRAFWESEEIILPKPISPEEQFCESHYRKNTQRNEDGQYIVRFPLQKSIVKLNDNRDFALNRFYKLESRFKKDPNYYKHYSENIQDYIQRGHLVPALKKSSYIMTHHGVVKRTANDIKVRVVFNPTERDTEGHSLNDSLLPGPKLHQDISIIITRFRLRPVALACDICQMFRCIIVNPEDRKYFHIFWRFNTNEPIIEFEHTRVIFGATSSPFLANRTVQQLVNDEGENYPLAAKALSFQTFVDDVLTGADSIEEALELKRQLINMLKAGGFDLGKWSSSDLDIIKNKEDSVELPIGNCQSLIKVLGIFWDTKDDIFQYKICDVNEPSTKRGMLSRVARTYDINGYLSPFTFLLKSLIQRLWLLKGGWDDPLPNDIMNKWIIIKGELTLLENIKIPRCIYREKTSCALVGFSDASILGMGAVIYLRTELNGRYVLNLLAAKTRVAPLKSWTIPKLELGAACLLSKLMRSTLAACEPIVKIMNLYCFVDSTTVLGWIKTPPYKLKTFAANRIVQIHENCPDVRWCYVPGKLNPADPASRGLTPKDLVDCDIWWNGPDFLLKHESQWKFEYEIPSRLPEIKEVPPISLLVNNFNCDELFDVLENFSSFLKIQRIFAYILRFCTNCRIRKGGTSKEIRINGPLTANEYEQGLLLAIRLTQAKYFFDEMNSIKRGMINSKKIRFLSPFISESGLLMVGGRLRHSQLSFRQKHPYLIPKESRLATLICDHYHLISGHGGPRLVQSLINRYYWIPNLRRLLRSRIFRCLRCYRFSAKPVQPPMGDLPSYRLDPGKCFSHTGLDYAGPFEVKVSQLRNDRYQKCYVALFICMVSRAIHLEVVTSLTTDACLAALDRFISRRGLPSNIYSDQGTNFRGAAREISEITKFFKDQSSEIFHYLSVRNITWSHNPPYAPHMGGLWEAGVKSFKYHLKRIIGNTKLHFEQFITIVTRIEAILNSRPFCNESSSPDDDLDPLTPGHFLVGAPLLARVEVDLMNIPQNRLTRWQLCQQLTQSFWKRWSNEYIHSLQKRPKWTKPSAQVKEGDLVLWYSPDAPPTHWPIGKISKLIPGADGIVRVVKIRTATGEIKRTLNKVSPLPPP